MKDLQELPLTNPKGNESRNSELSPSDLLVSSLSQKGATINAEAHYSNAKNCIEFSIHHSETLVYRIDLLNLQGRIYTWTEFEVSPNHQQGQLSLSAIAMESGTYLFRISEGNKTPYKLRLTLPANLLS